MKQWWLIIALLLSLGINIGLFAGRFLPAREVPEAAMDPEPPPPPPGRERDRLPPVARRMADELGLAGEERRAFLDIQRTFFQQTLSARARVGRLQAQVRREMFAEEPDREAIDGLLERIAEAHVDLERAFVDNLLAARELLDPEQEKRYLRFLHRLRQMRNRRDRPPQDRPPRFGPGGGPPPDPPPERQPRQRPGGAA